MAMVFALGMLALFCMAVLALGLLLGRAMRQLYGRRLEHNMRRHLLENGIFGGKKDAETIDVSTIVLPMDLHYKKQICLDFEDEKSISSFWAAEGAFPMPPPPAYANSIAAGMLHKCEGMPPPEYSHEIKHEKY